MRASDPVGRPYVRTRSAEQTEALGARLAVRLPAATVVGLVGPLGAGKTCFVRGMAAGLGIDAREVTSPTFVYLVDHRTPAGIVLSHADLYRLATLPEDSADQVYAEIGLQAAVDGEGLTVVEWWDHYRGTQPARLMVVEFVLETSNDRLISFDFTGPGLERAARELAAP